MMNIKKERLIETYLGANIWVGKDKPLFGKLELVANGGLVIVQTDESGSPQERKLKYSVRRGNFVHLPDEHQYVLYKVD
ncbi:MAG TPA: hypothetical protein VJH92_03225 [Candidatus Nanoarchaeia archaeon]|nr:hypothetical protein [Candidatus Nanoarchaeia archaeon]